MKIKVDAYVIFNGVVGHCFLDPEDPKISYSTYRRLMRACPPNSNLRLYWPELGNNGDLIVPVVRDGKYLFDVFCYGYIR